MIDPATGELCFDELAIRPHQTFFELAVIIESLGGFKTRQKSPLPGLSTLVPNKYLHHPEYGNFHVGCTFEPEHHLVLVTACHQDDFYQKETPYDGERKVFHENIVNRDLAGQREFSWGEIIYYLCEQTCTHHIGIIYSPGPGVPLPFDHGPKQLAEHAIPPCDE